MIQTIKSVKDTPNYWEKGETYFVEGEFEDGSQFSRGAKTEERAHQYLQELKNLIGSPAEFELESKPEKYNKAQWKLKNVIGKQSSRPLLNDSSPPPVRSSGYQVRFRDTEEGFLREQRSIHRSVALQYAVAFCKDNPTFAWDSVIEHANYFYDWLSRSDPQPSAAAPQVSAPPQSVAAGGPPASPTASNHPSLDELKDRFGLATADELGRAKFSGMIQQALQEKNSAAVSQGGRIGVAIIEAHGRGELNREDEEVLYQEILAARRVLSGGP